MPESTEELQAALARVEAERDALAAKLDLARHYVLAVEQSPIAIMCVSAVKGRYVFVNEEYVRLVGYERAELMERDPYELWLEVTHPDDAAIERGLVGRLGKGEVDRFQLDKRLTTRGGTMHWVHTECRSSRDSQGRLEYIVVSFQDIGAHRAAEAARDQLEAQLRQAEKLGTVGKLVGGIAHDFNNRLAIIMGYGDLLCSSLATDDPLYHHATMVLESAKGAAQLTRQLLAYGRRQVLKPVSFDLNEMVDRMRRLLRSVVDDRIEIIVSPNARSPIFADVGQIEQVILNLALNARDAMPGGGRLSLATADAADDMVALIVSDTGTGIADEVLPHIFEPFFTTKDVGQGTGLGLAMVQGIVKQSGGSTSVDSRPETGTTFTVLLPRGRAAPAFATPPTVSAPPLSGSYEAVLIVDDNDDVRNLLVGILTLRAYAILTARNGRHALEVAAQHAGPIHLLVTDVAMPEMGGIELGAVLREARPGLKVLFTSGHAEHPELLSKPLDADTHFLPKPFLPGELTRAVVTLLEGSPAADEPAAQRGFSEAKT